MYIAHRITKPFLWNNNKTTLIGKRIRLPSHKAMFVFIDNVLPPTSALISNMYYTHRDMDGFLYMTYSGENTFGNLFLN